MSEGVAVSKLHIADEFEVPMATHEEPEGAGQAFEGVTTKDKVSLASRAVQDDKSMRETVQKFSLPPSSLDIEREHHENTEKRLFKTLVDKKLEDQVADWYLQTIKIGCPLIKKEVSKIMKHILDKKRMMIFPPENLPCLNWVERFLSRYPEVLKAVVGAKHIRNFKTKVMYGDIQAFFNRFEEFLQSVYDINPFDFLTPSNAHRIFSCDETGFFLKATDENEVIFESGNKYQYRTRDGKSVISVLFCVSAAGDMVKPVILNEGTRPTTYEKFPDLDVSSYAVAASGSGWMTSDVYFWWIAMIFSKYLKERKIRRPVVLFLDGESSSISPATIHVAREHGIIIYCVHPNASNILHPLHVCGFKAMKVKYREVLAESFGTRYPYKLAIKHFPYTLMKTLYRSKVGENAVTGFEASGLLPFDPLRIEKDKLLG